MEDGKLVAEGPSRINRAIVPDVLLPAHAAALGITFYDANQFPQRYRNGAFVALHGSLLVSDDGSNVIWKVSARK